MKSVARVMHAELILLLVLFMAAPAFAAYESGPVGPYNVSFDMNTTMKYTVIVETPSSGVTSLGVNFVRYNLTVDSADYLAWLILTRYEDPMVANITANEYIVYNALLNAGADKPNLYQPLIDGRPGVLGNFRFERQLWARGSTRRAILWLRPATLRSCKSLSGWSVPRKDRLPYHIHLPLGDHKRPSLYPACGSAQRGSCAYRAVIYHQPVISPQPITSTQPVTAHQPVMSTISKR